MRPDEPLPAASTSKPRLRILLSAFAFDPASSSESYLGWRVASGLAQAGHDVTVLFGHLRPGLRDPKNLHAIEASCREAGMLRPVHIEADENAKRLALLSGKPGFWWLYYRAYRCWQRQAWETARKLHAEQPFDLTHQLNFIGFREPGEIWKLGVPHFWGPISGSPMVPWSFLKSFGPGQFYRWGGRNLGNWWQIRMSRRCKAAARASERIWTVSASDLAMVENHWGAKAVQLLETGATASPQRPPRTRAPGEPLRLVWSGRFDPIKVLPVVLQAVDGLEHGAWTLDILGDGPEGRDWKALGSSLPSAKYCNWHGMLPREKALTLMDAAHVCIHSSIKEGTPHVVLESLGMGLPVICHDACGMGTAVNARCGIKIPLLDPQTSTTGFRDAIRRLLDEPDLLQQLSEGATRRAAELSWESKVVEFSNAYHAKLGPSA